MPSMTTVLRLEEVRRKKGVSLEQIADTTKISTSFLRAIESEEFEKLPGGVYNSNYIRQYAKAIGFCEDRLLTLYRDVEAAREQMESMVVPPIQPKLTLRWMSWFVSPATRP